MRRDVVSGLVTLIENVDDHLSFVTLTPVRDEGSGDEGWFEKRVPLYMPIERAYLDKFVSITSVRSGFLGKDFKQTIEGTNMLSSMTMPYSLVRDINDAYRNHKQRHLKLYYFYSEF
jgi:hypothetical protein